MRASLNAVLVGALGLGRAGEGVGTADACSAVGCMTGCAAPSVVPQMDQTRLSSQHGAGLFAAAGVRLTPWLNRQDNQAP
jgi:hypothetical protein